MGGSPWALLGAIVVYVADWLSGLFMSGASGHPNAGGAVVRMIFVTYMVQGLLAAFALRRDAHASAINPGKLRM
jgi:hypothetical protein